METNQTARKLIGFFVDGGETFYRLSPYNPASHKSYRKTFAGAERLARRRLAAINAVYRVDTNPGEYYNTARLESEQLGWCLRDAFGRVHTDLTWAGCEFA